jgi:GMP synthase (glutamine-hydrolysing)
MRIYDLPIPILGLCFGHQEIAKHYGGRVEHTEREYGSAKLFIQGKSPIFAGLDSQETVWMSHGDTVTLAPPNFDEIGISNSGGLTHSNSAIASDSLRRYGFQFHPEVDDTIHGDQMLKNFCINICECTPNWTMQNYINEGIERSRAQSKGRPVFLLVSGGVDSTVCAVLLGKALGPQNLHLLHIDNGLMRKNESALVVSELTKRGLSQNLHYKDASNTFLRNLKGVTDPESKRRIIGETFIDVFREEAERLNLQDCLLAQGTIYPDTIETGGTKRADIIKTHHNRIPLVQKMIDEGNVIEPLAELYKTEVRELGEQLGLPEEIVWRHPFPGPGLGIRLICSDGKTFDQEKLAESQQALKKIGDEVGISGIVLPVRSVGVKADLRSYEHPVMLWGNLTAEDSASIASKIFQKVPGINRCILDLTNDRTAAKMPSTKTAVQQFLILTA